MPDAGEKTAIEPELPEAFKLNCTSAFDIGLPEPSLTLAVAFSGEAIVSELRDCPVAGSVSAIVSDAEEEEPVVVDDPGALPPHPTMRRVKLRATKAVQVFLVRLAAHISLSEGCIFVL